MDWISIDISLEDPNENDYRKMKLKDIILWSQGWVIREAFVCGNCKNRGCLIEVDFGHPLPKKCICPDTKLLTEGT